LHARRLVALRCLYGVDKNPMATDLAKLSLWLATLARDHEFTFLDHALKSGDSLVGLTRVQISLHWDSGKPGLPLFRNLIRERFEAALAGRAEIRDAPDDVERAIQEARYQQIERRLSYARHLGDAVIAAFLSADKPRAREARRQEIESWLNEPPEATWIKIQKQAGTLRNGKRPVPPFHWELEFPEVFARDNPGFDAIVGNPPFLGGKRISTELGDQYRDWLPTLHDQASQNTDLVGHFFRRAHRLTRGGGVFGLVATNTIAQGDTREGALTQILNSGASIYRALRRMVWPGDAAVVVSVIHIIKLSHMPGILDHNSVKRISSYLVDGYVDHTPAALSENFRKSFVGSIILGLGFTFDDDPSGDLASSIADMERLTNENPKLSECILPYIGGEEVNNDPKHRHRRYVIDFDDLEELQVRARWPKLMDIVEEKVKPQRAKLKRPVYRDKWWRFAEPQTALYEAVRGLPRVLVVAQVSPHLAFTFLPNGMVYSSTLIIFVFSDSRAFATLHSRTHEVWVRNFSASLKDDQRYIPTDCFSTFPRPYWNDGSYTIGETYHSHRGNIMLMRNQGLTAIYNAFHNRHEATADIVRLRELHADIDRTVLRAYGWDDLAERAEPRFLDETNEDDHKYRGRLFWPAEFRDEVLARLLALNAERAAAERASGIVHSAQRNGAEQRQLEGV
jgi:hypothetical protein